MTIKNFGVVSGPGDGGSGDIWENDEIFREPTGYFFQNKSHISCNLCQTESQIATFRAAGTDVTNCFIDLNGGFLSTLTLGSNMTMVKGEITIDKNLTCLANGTFTGSVTAQSFIGNVTGNLNGIASGNKPSAAFDIPHVKEKGKRIRHLVAEGPEPGIYIRGQLKDSNIIELPEYWDGLVDTETITVTLTQIGYSQDLIVDKIEWGKRIRVRSGNGANIHCFYEVWAARWLNPMDHDEKLHVVYEGESPADYPGGNENFLIGGWDYDRRETKWRDVK